MFCKDFFHVAHDVVRANKQTHPAYIANFSLLGLPRHDEPWGAHPRLQLRGLSNIENISEKGLADGNAEMSRSAVIKELADQEGGGTR